MRPRSLLLVPVGVVVALSLFLALALAGQRAEGKSKPKAPAARWFAFAAYPRAVQLCSEHVSGNSMHIEWRSYASRDSVAKIVAFYEKDQQTKASDADPDTGERTITAPTDSNAVISIYPAGKADAFPSCEKKAGKKDKTVILVSLRTGASKP